MRIADLIPNVTGSYPKDFLMLVELVDGQQKTNGNSSTDLLWPAYRYSKENHEGQLRKSGRPYFEHCIAVAQLLAEWNMDLNTIIGGILHDCIEDTNSTFQEVSDEFGEEVAELVDGVTKLGGIEFDSRREKQAENLMKMFLSMAKDLRVIIIKFADRLHNMRTIEYLPLIKQRRIAVETRDVYSPLAHRLGMFAIKSELDNLVLSALEPDAFKEIEKFLKSTGSKRKRTLKEISEPIEKQMAEYSIDYRTKARLKSHSSIHNKMVAREKPFDEIYDIFALRILVQDVAQCYTVLGLIHQVFTPVHERFKDFIATPKINGYQSLHTTVISPSGKMVEIQIRTEEMDRTAEIGVAAHWRYKGGEKRGELDRHVQWLRDLVSILSDESADPGEFMNLLKIDLFQNEVFVFTPAGDLVQLPAGSTPIDFAYDVHTEVGHHCLSAKVDGKIIPLNTELKSGQTVEVISSDSQLPSPAWLKFVRTTKARTHIRRFQRRSQIEESGKLGKEILEKTLRRMKMMERLKELTSQPELSGFSDTEAMMVAIGSGQKTVREVLRKAFPKVTEADYEEAKEKSSFLDFARRSAKGVSVHGIGNILINFGKCCNPIPGDDIVGFVTRGRGVTVHRAECGNLPIMSESSDRFLEVEWDVAKKTEFLSQLTVVAEDRKGYLKDVTEAISALGVNITSVDIKVEDGIASCVIVISILNVRRLNMVIRRLENLPGTVTIRRTS
ncbi:MAG: bifunctional (p)ppGpp synthetase/guanosine-3',5'-bis(diphosphate) 3'-pyrophosphohydrolase [Candidatus Neomarinimicrobiota bacterium]|nr:bifunctional (p)ppGpp synthetase/guanosine-3',5'-bis(diphosphate) 3'-pyrophosphohydrolase [Candidatus Neomarinimicrobiota bacterium]